MNQLVQILGSLLVLAAFTAAQRGWRSQAAKPYPMLNFVGSAMLSAEAVIERQWDSYS